MRASVLKRTPVEGLKIRARRVISKRNAVQKKGGGSQERPRIRVSRIEENLFSLPHFHCRPTPAEDRPRSKANLPRLDSFRACYKETWRDNRASRCFLPLGRAGDVGESGQVAVVPKYGDAELIVWANFIVVIRIDLFPLFLPARAKFHTAEKTARGSPRSARSLRESAR